MASFTELRLLRAGRQVGRQAGWWLAGWLAGRLQSSIYNMRAPSAELERAPSSAVLYGDDGRHNIPRIG